MKAAFLACAFGAAFAASALAQSATVTGKVTKIDASAQKFTIDHGPMKEFDMPAMTMVFLAGDEAMLKAVKAGDRVFSSGDGGLLPPDLPIGEVVTSGSELRVALFADPERSDYVHVVDYTAPLEPPPGVAADSLPAVAPSKPADIVGAVAPASVGPAATPARPLAGGGQAALAVSRNLAQVVRPAGRVAVPPSPTSDEEEGHGSGEE